MVAGRQAAGLIRGIRADAAASRCPGDEPRSRRRFRLVALLIGVVGLAVCLAYGSLVAQAIGHGLSTPGIIRSSLGCWMRWRPGGEGLVWGVRSWPSPSVSR